MKVDLLHPKRQRVTRAPTKRKATTKSHYRSESPMTNGERHALNEVKREIAFTLWARSKGCDVSPEQVPYLADALDRAVSHVKARSSVPRTFYYAPARYRFTLGHSCLTLSRLFFIDSETGRQLVGSDYFSL
jgi:hypothetical protein